MILVIAIIHWLVIESDGSNLAELYAALCFLWVVYIL